MNEPWTMPRDMSNEAIIKRADSLIEMVRGAPEFMQVLAIVADDARILARILAKSEGK